MVDRQFPVVPNRDFGFDCVRCGRATVVWSDDQHVCGCRNAAANRVLEQMVSHWVNNSVYRSFRKPVVPVSKR
jgi:hypothetical protein